MNKKAKKHIIDIFKSVEKFNLKNLDAFLYVINTDALFCQVSIVLDYIGIKLSLLIIYITRFKI